MSEKKSEKNPYRVHTLEEIRLAETGYYYIQIGDTLFQSESGKLAFKKDRADHFYMAIWGGLNDMKKNGTPKQRKEAIECLLNLRVVPLRFQ